MTKSKVKVLSEGDENWLETMGGKQWQRRSRAHVEQRKRHYKLLDTFADAIAEHGAADPLDPQMLRTMLAVALSKDGTFGGEFRDRKADALNSDEGMEKLWGVCAGKIVEDYLRRRDGPVEVKPALLLDTDVQRTISDLLTLAVQQGELSEREGRAAKEGFLLPAHAPDMVEGARGRLEELLAADINVAHRVNDGEIPESARETEIAKGALMKLKIGQLRKIAASEQLPVVNDPEAIATLIVRKYNASRSEIAELILQYSKGNPEIGYATHLLPQRGAPELTVARERVSQLTGSYLRLAVAHWLVFDKPPAGTTGGAASTVAFSGEMRYYDLAAQREGEVSEITAKKRTAPITVRLQANVAWAEVDGHNITEIRRIRPALHNNLGVPTVATLEANVPALDGAAAQWDRTSLLMLHILDPGLRDQHVDYTSFTMARFSSPNRSGAPDDPGKPAIKQVSLAGTHVLSSPEACRLIANGRRMLTVEFRARYKADLAQAGSHASVRISLEADHASVMTSYGEDRAQSKALHRELVRRLRHAIDKGIAEAKQLDRIVGQIAKRAGQAGEAQSADILGPEEEIRAGRIGEGAVAERE